MRVEATDGSWVDLTDRDVANLRDGCPIYIEVRTSGLTFGAFFDGEQVTHSIANFTSPDWLRDVLEPALREALA